MNKPEQLFPPSANCPACGKKIRIKWAPPRDVLAGLTGAGRMKCLHCGADHVRAVGPENAIHEASRIMAAFYHDACGHDHGDGEGEGEGKGEDENHGHDPMHGVAVIPGGETFAYIRLPG